MNRVEQAYKEYYCKGDALPKCQFKAEEQGFKAGAEWAVSEVMALIKERYYDRLTSDDFEAVCEIAEIRERIKGLLK